MGFFKKQLSKDEKITDFFWRSNRLQEAVENLTQTQRPLTSDVSTCYKESQKLEKEYLHDTDVVNKGAIFACRGVLESMRGDIPKGIEFLNMGIDLDGGNNYWARWKKAYLHLVQGQNELALREAKASLKNLKQTQKTVKLMKEKGILDSGNDENDNTEERIKALITSLEQGTA